MVHNILINFNREIIAVHKLRIRHPEFERQLLGVSNAKKRISQNRKPYEADVNIIKQKV